MSDVVFPATVIAMEQNVIVPVVPARTDVKLVTMVIAVKTYAQGVII